MARGNPVFAAGAAMIYGYLAALLRREPLLVNAAEARTYRRLLNSRISGGLKTSLPFRR